MDEESNKFKEMTEREAIEQCEHEIYALAFDLMNAHGNYAGKVALTSILDSLEENGYFI